MVIVVVVVIESRCKMSLCAGVGCWVKKERACGWLLWVPFSVLTLLAVQWKVILQVLFMGPSPTRNYSKKKASLITCVQSNLAKGHTMQSYRFTLCIMLCYLLLHQMPSYTMGATHLEVRYTTLPFWKSWLHLMQHLN